MKGGERASNEIDGPAIDASRLAGFQDALLGWFARQGADLPWRRNRAPYAVLVSEFMLQQTGRERVVPKFLAFLERFPTLEELAGAPASSVIRAWAGLGYNSRALRLHRLARMLVDTDGVPGDVERLRLLPGVGPYTAGAIACFAFDARVAFVDTNIRRVLRRVLRGEQYPEAATLDWQIAERALPAGSAADWNAALMDLGAGPCRARSPRCGECPVISWCLAASRFAPADVNGAVALVAEAPVPYGGGNGRRPRQRPQTYQSTDRYLRGRIIDVLRGMPDGAMIGVSELALAATGMALPPQSERIEALTERLVAEGLVHAEADEHRQRRYRLPE